ncbi:MAG TPA: CDP-glucose 4,6-dehydratase [Candidatus Competibacteraceae bacterium]|nr:CDP-glucose 4,6-dehydratase [Candidatus Competibacteraceae bacterium]HPF58170.1 CDP-glucose 4,6-dehydratase [Candidatus Competibacteraceae bacterium]
MTPDFWQGRRVLVTGHTGFKGGWLCLWLQRLGAKVTGYALTPPTQPSLFETARIGKGMHSILGDIRDFDALRAAVAACRPEVIFHLAAQPLVVSSYQQPVVTYATNVMGTVHLLEAVHQIGNVRAVVNVTSDKCYANREWLWGYRENEPMGGDDPYSSSKGCAELVTAAYRASFFSPADYAQHGVALASARAGNVIGGGDWAAHRLIPDLIRAFQTGRAVPIRCPEAVRPWQHVLEPLSGYLTLAERLFIEGPAFAEGWNFGPAEADARPVQWLVDRLAVLWGNGATWKLDEEPHPHEAHYLKLDCAKTQTHLGWTPRWNLEEALAKAIEWYQSFFNHVDMQQLSLHQLAEFEAAMD